MGDLETRGSVGARKSRTKIPDGTKVRHRREGYEGTIDGLTAIVAHGANLNPDGRTQYRIKVEAPRRNLAAEEDLLILLDSEGLIMMDKAKAEYRRYHTDELRRAFTDDYFVS
jgi:hypothetical protein